MENRSINDLNSCRLQFSSMPTLYLNHFESIEGNKETSAIVDVGDKNSLAQLTVVQKLNHSR
jgi:hypothetical protein